MNILIFGNDSTAHLLAWKLVNSHYVDEVILAPGNSGTAIFAPSTPLTWADAGAVANFVLSESIDLVIADSAAAQAGLPDELRALPLPVVGASRALVAMTRSRCATREWLQRHALPLPRGRVCATQVEAEKFAASLGLPLLVAPDLVDGQIVTCTERAAIPRAIGDCFAATGSAGVVVEELVPGPVVTASILTDGERALAIPAARLYPPIGVELAAWQPSHGGAGVHSAATPLWTRLESFLESQIRQPLMQALRTDGHDAQGWIGATCVLSQRGPVVRSLHLVPSGLELAATLPRLTGDLLPLMIGSARRTLTAVEPPEWSDAAVVGVTLMRMAPGHSDSDITSSSFEAFEPGLLVFHHATRPVIPNTYVPRSGRQSTPRSGWTSFIAGTSAAHIGAGAVAEPAAAIVVAQGTDVATARERLYANLRRTHLTNIVYNDQIGSREL